MTATTQESIPNSSGKGFINYLRLGREQEPDQRGPRERDGPQYCTTGIPRIWSTASSSGLPTSRKMRN